MGQKEENRIGGVASQEDLADFGIKKFFLDNQWTFKSDAEAQPALYTHHTKAPPKSFPPPPEGRRPCLENTNNQQPAPISSLATKQPEESPNSPWPNKHKTPLTRYSWGAWSLAKAYSGLVGGRVPCSSPTATHPLALAGL